MADGSGVTVAIIDSGVHPNHPHINADRLLSGLALGPDGWVIESGIPLDRLGHGTAVTAAVQEKAPAAQILPIRVFHESLRGSALALSTAIDWAAAQGAHLINLSLGTTNAAHRALFEASVAGARARGSIILAASEAEGTPCLPGSLRDVIGVGLDWDIPREVCCVEGGRIIASGYPRPIEGVPLRRNLYGISFAVAQASGLAACALQTLREQGVTPTPENLLAALAG
jgi:hypothetical protein